MHDPLRQCTKNLRIPYRIDLRNSAFTPGNHLNVNINQSVISKLFQHRVKAAFSWRATSARDAGNMPSNFVTMQRLLIEHV